MTVPLAGSATGGRARGTAGTGRCPVTAPVVEVRNVRKTYGDRVVLDDVSLTVDTGDVVCLIGSSGSGKSTLLRCRPARGRRRRSDRVRGPRDLRPARRSARGPEVDRHGLPGLQPLSPPLGAGQLHAGAPQGPRPVEGRGGGDGTGAARPVRTGRAVDKHPDRLSGGQQQRAALVRALCTSRGCCSSTRSPPRSTPSWSVTCSPSCAASRRAARRWCWPRTRWRSRVTCHPGLLPRRWPVLESGPPGQVLVAPEQPRTREFLRRVLPG